MAFDGNNIITVITLTKAYSGSPSFVAGDKIYVYWNSITQQIIVKKNDAATNSFTTITSGPTDIFNANQFTNVQTKKTGGGGLSTLFTSFYSFCSGTTLNTFTGTYYLPLFPYVSRNQQLNAPACSIVVCDLKFTNVPLVTSPTTSYSTDGSIQVYATSSHEDVSHPIRFSLSDVDYSSMSNTSGLFTGLAIGPHVIYATDSSNCKANITITIPSATLYQPKLRLEFNDQQFNATTRVDISERGFTGSPVAIKGGDSPMVLSKPQTDLHNKFEALRPTFCTLTLASEKNYQYLPLFTQDDRKFLVQVYKPVGTLSWSGFIKPSVFSESMGLPTYYTTVNVIDGVEELQNIDFLDSNGSFTDFYGNKIIGTRISGVMKVIAIIKIVMDKLNLHLPYRVACNMTELNLGIDPIINSYFDTDTFFDHSQNQPWKCDAVLKALLAPIGCFIIQSNGRWNIVRGEEQCASYNYIDLDENLNETRSGTYDPVVEIKDPDLRLGAVLTDIEQATLEIVPAYGYIDVKHNLIAKPSLLADYDFDISNFDGLDFKGWLIDRTHAPGVIVKCENIVIDNVADQINKMIHQNKFDISIGSYAMAISNIEGNPTSNPYDPLSTGAPSGGPFLRVKSVATPIEYVTDSFDFSFDYRVNLSDVQYDNENNVQVMANKQGNFFIGWQIYLQTTGMYFSSKFGWVNYEVWNQLEVTSFDTDENFNQTIALPNKTTLTQDKIVVAFDFSGFSHVDCFTTTAASGQLRDSFSGHTFPQPVVSYFDDATLITAIKKIPTINLPLGSKIKTYHPITLTNQSDWPKTIVTGVITEYELKETDASGGSDVNQIIYYPNDFSSTNAVKWMVSDYQEHVVSGGAYYLWPQTFVPLKLPVRKIYLDSVIINFNPLYNKIPALEDLLIVNNDKLKENLPVELNGGDIPDVPINSAKYVYLNFFRDADGNPTGTWKRNGISESLTMQKILLKSLVKQYASPSYKISGSLLAFADLNFLSIIKHTQPADTAIVLLNPELTWSGSSTIITNWQNIITIGWPTWTGASDNKATVVLGSGNTNSSYLAQSPALPIGAANRVSVEITCTRTGSGTRIDELHIILLDASNNIIEDILVAGFQYNNTITKIVKFNVTQDSANIGFYIKNISTGGDATYKVDYFRLNALSIVRFYYFNQCDINNQQNMINFELIQLIPLLSGADATVDDSGDNSGGGTNPGTGGGYSGGFSSGFGAGFDTVLN